MELIRRTLKVFGVVALLAISNASVVTYASDDDQSSNQQEHMAWPALPKVQLTLVDSFEDEASYLAKTAADIAEREQEAAQTSDQQQKVDFLLAAANQVLAYQLEPMISLQLLGLGEEAKEDDQSQLSSALAHVRELLGNCETIIDEYRQGELDDDQQAWHLQAKRRLRLLHGFAAGVEALTNAKLDQTSLRSASSQLSVLREDSNGAVISASGYWQAVVRSKMNDPARALDVLPLALDRVSPDSLPHSFYARILRCELLARQGKYAASLALLTDIEEQCSDWFSQEASQDAASRTVSWMQLKILKRWHKSLLEQGKKTEAQWCVIRANSMIERQFTDGNMSLLRLVPAVPIVTLVVDANHKDDTASESNP